MLSKIRTKLLSGNEYVVNDGTCCETIQASTSETSNATVQENLDAPAIQDAPIDPVCTVPFMDETDDSPASENDFKFIENNQINASICTTNESFPCNASQGSSLENSYNRPSERQTSRDASPSSNCKSDAETQSSRKYSSPFVYASPYSAYAARRASLRSPSLWCSDKASLNHLSSTGHSPSSRLSYVTPTFGGESSSARKAHQFSLAESSKQNPNSIEASNSENHHSMTTALHSKYLMDLSATKHAFKLTNQNTTPIEGPSNPKISKTSSCNISPSTNGTTDISRDGSQIFPDGRELGEKTSTDLPCPAAEVDSNVPRSLSSEQKRMSTIDSRLKVLPGQLSEAKSRTAQQQEVGSVLKEVIRFEGKGVSVVICLLTFSFWHWW